MLNENDIHYVSKTGCRIFAITLSNINRFWKFFHCWKQQ